jgi:hypothetical protein
MSKKSNGSKFRPLQLRVPSWSGGEENDAPPFTGIIRKAREIVIDGEPRKALEVELTDDTQDGEGQVFAHGDIVLVWQNAALLGLENYVDKEVRITPKGYGEREGKKSAPRLFDVEIAE